MLKIFHVDTETTGKHSSVHSIHQLAAIIEVNGEVVDRINVKMRPRMGRHIEDEALKVGGVTRQQVMQYPMFTDGMATVLRMLAKHAVLEDPKDKFFISGYGSEHFDKGFLHDLFVAAGQRTFADWFYSASLDSMVLAAHVLRNERNNMQNFKLETVAKRLNIEVDPQQLHKAEYDVQLHYEVYSALTRMFR